MTLSGVIRMADEIKPNAFSEEVKTSWVNEAEGMVQTEVMLIAIEDVTIYSWEEDQGTELLVRPPHDKLYWTYLTAMIDFANGEYNKYQNTMQLFNAYFSEYMRWFAERYRPADGEDVQGWPGYYISSYGIAVKHGFVGTEEEWLETLRGDPGAAGEPGKDFRILGRYDTFEMLRSSVPNPETGDTYDVGTEYPYDAYMWDGVNRVWVNKGPFRGPQGEDGYTPVKGVDYFDGQDGEDGYSPTVTIYKDGKTTTISITDVNGTKTATVEDGEDGTGGDEMYVMSYGETLEDVPETADVVIDPYAESDSEEESGVEIDNTLTQSGKAADAKAVGDALAEQAEAIAEKLDATALPEAINAALAQAKESGEFDGEPGQPGTTPHIGANGNWYIGETDTGVKAQGEPGDDYVLTEADKAEIADIAADLVDVPDGTDGDYIPVPATASVGQTIKVSAVDESGKPTAWEAVDFPEGGGGNLEWRKVLEVTTDEEVTVFDIDVAKVLDEIRNAPLLAILLNASEVSNTEIGASPSGTFQWITGGVTRTWLEKKNFLPRTAAGGTYSFGSLTMVKRGFFLVGEPNNEFAVFDIKPQVQNLTQGGLYNQELAWGYLNSTTQKFRIIANDTAIGAGSRFRIFVAG